MRRATENKPQGREQISNIVSIPAPIGGWNAYDPIANMPITDALVLDNWFPRPGYCEIRGGSSSHATGMTGNAKTLAVYNGANGTNKLFCATATNIYNVTSAGAVGASVATVTSGKFQQTMFGDGTNTWLIMLNGVDKPLYYDGSTWLAVDGVTSPALTGITTTSLIGVTVFKGRLFFIEKNSLAFWYLAAGVAGGALTKFDLSGVTKRGGYLVAAESWTVDAGNGIDDRMVFMTSEGDVLIYQGTNPSSATTWGLVGVYNIGKPLGRKCFIKIDSDLAILTNNGIYGMPTVLNGTDANNEGAISKKIGRIFNESAQNYINNYGWSITILKDQSAAIVNVPVTEDGTHYQYVMNTITNSWCRFTGWNAEDFTVFNDELYYCTGTTVIKAWTGNADQGGNVEAYAKTAFNYFEQRGQLKQFGMIRPTLSVNGNINFLLDIDVDFADSEIVGTASYTVPNVALWGSALWGIDYWGSGLKILSEWGGVSSWPGYCAAAKLKIATNSIDVQWLSTDYVYEVGNGI